MSSWSQKADTFVLMESEKRLEPYYCSWMWWVLKGNQGIMTESVKAIKAAGYTLSDGLTDAKLRRVPLFCLSEVD